jgi:hypothetical protein
VSILFCALPDFRFRVIFPVYQLKFIGGELRFPVFFAGRGAGRFRCGIGFPEKERRPLS